MDGTRIDQVLMMMILLIMAMRRRLTVMMMMMMMTMMMIRLPLHPPHHRLDQALPTSSKLQKGFPSPSPWVDTS